MTIITGQRLYAFLFDQGIDIARVTPEINDSRYALPSIEGIEECLPYVRDQLNKHVGLYDAEDADCDDFAKACDFVFKEIHRKTEIRPKNTALAFGVFTFIFTNNKPHAINVAIVNKGGDLTLVFIEPQLCEFIELTQEQIQSCYGITF